MLSLLSEVSGLLQDMALLDQRLSRLELSEEAR